MLKKIRKFREEQIASAKIEIEGKRDERLAQIGQQLEEALTQENLAPRAWAGRLAPEELPDFSGFEVGRVYQAGSGGVIRKPGLRRCRPS